MGQPQPEMMSREESMNLALWITSVAALIARLFICFGMGTNAIGTEGFIAFLAIPFIATLAHSPEMIQFWYACIAAMIVQRVMADRRQKTKYVGWPWLTQCLTLGLLPERAMRMLEPVLVYAIARLLAPWSMPVAKLLMFSAFSVGLHNAIHREQMKRRRDAIHDAQIESYGS